MTGFLHDLAMTALPVFFIMTGIPMTVLALYVCTTTEKPTRK